MPDLQSELKKLSMPHSKLLKLVWEFVKDNPGTTNKKVLSHFSKVASPVAVSRNTYDLLARGMLVTEKRRIPRSPRLVNFYTVNPRMQGNYEEWPRPSKAVEPKVPANPATVAPVKPKALPELKEVEPYQLVDRTVQVLHDVDLELLVDRMPVKLAKQLHGMLTDLFKGD